MVKPKGTASASALLKVCNQYRVPVTTRGGGIGLSGAVLPIFGGILLSMERFKAILDIDLNSQATVNPV